MRIRAAATCIESLTLSFLVCLQFDACWSFLTSRRLGNFLLVINRVLFQKHFGYVFVFAHYCFFQSTPFPAVPTMKSKTTRNNKTVSSSAHIKFLSPAIFLTTRWLAKSISLTNCSRDVKKRRDCRDEIQTPRLVSKFFKDPCKHHWFCNRSYTAPCKEAV